MKFELVCDDVQTAIYAAKHVHQWGRAATLKWVENRGCPIRLYTIARQLLAAEKGGF